MDVCGIRRNHLVDPHPIEVQVRFLYPLCSQAYGMNNHVEPFRPMVMQITI